MGPIKTILIAIVKVYQKTLSPLFPNSCRYYPTCSHYTITAIKTHNIFYALYLSTKRILKCNPLFKGGIDEVPTKKGHKHE